MNRSYSASDAAWSASPVAVCGEAISATSSWLAGGGVMLAWSDNRGPSKASRLARRSNKLPRLRCPATRPRLDSSVGKELLERHVGHAANRAGHRQDVVRASARGARSDREQARVGPGGA